MGELLPLWQDGDNRWARSAKKQWREEHKSDGQKPKADDSNGEDRFTVPSLTTPEQKPITKASCDRRSILCTD
jgi:hypothetical protein